MSERTRMWVPWRHTVPFKDFFYPLWKVTNISHMIHSGKL